MDRAVEIVRFAGSRCLGMNAHRGDRTQTGWRPMDATQGRTRARDQCRALLPDGYAVGLGEFACCGRDTPPHEHETVRSLELALVRRGVMEREYRGRAVLQVPGSLMLFEEGQAYRMRHPVAGGDVCDVVSVPVDLVESIAPAVAQRDRRTGLRGSVMLADTTWLVLRSGLEAARRGDWLRAEEEVVGLLPDLLHELDGPARAPGWSSERAGQRSRDVTAHVIREISTRYSERLSLRSLASMVHVSPFHLTRIVSATCGLPVHQILVRHRLREGVEQLLAGATSLSRLALDLGFSSHSHFTASFRVAFGVTPAAVRSSWRTSGRGMARSLRSEARSLTTYPLNRGAGQPL